MLQAIIKKGKVLSEEVPAPKVERNCVLIKVVNSCISSGTEISAVANTNKSLLQKAKEKPEKVKKVIDKIKSDGITGAINLVKSELSIGSTTGYSVSGIIVEIGEGVNNFEIGDRVAAASGNANHAEYVNVPINLICKIPDELDFPEASTVALGAISMQGVRRADLKMSEFCVVFGTGILGLITIQILKNAGIRVAAVDIDQNRLLLAKSFGAEITISGDDNSVNSVLNWTGGYGADAVIFTAATQSSDPLSNSFKMCKRKGKVILVGVSGLQINREDIYQKELDFQISTSYGPGRYDINYEEKGIDYPYGYVRWTENRIMKDYLRLLSEGKISLNKIITDKVDISKISEAYDKLQFDKQHQLMIIVDYKNTTSENIVRKVSINKNPINKDRINVAIVGIGSFAKNIHLPNLQKLNDKFNIYAIMNRNGYKGKAIAENYNAKYVTTNYDEIINDPNVDLILISTRHDSHGELVYKALQKGKNVFVEKPLTTDQESLKLIEDFYNSESQFKPALFVGYNRRFSKYINEIRKHTEKRINPLFITYRMNAGFVSLDHWVHESGGRIVGELCHIIDLVTSLTKSIIVSISFENLTPQNQKFSKTDNISCILKYSDGSIANLNYFAVGAKDLEKEYMEIHFDEKSIILNDYKSLKGYGLKINEIKSEKSEKGHLEELEVVYNYLKNNNSELPIQLWDLFQTTKVTLALK
ncbi:MAG: bi-domain-containing oxidoreductase [Ignavibacteriae bacterium]|nr:bi-domain-containing oxidoreductase [Ignavibacteriota bacterium]